MSLRPQSHTGRMVVGLVLGWLLSCLCAVVLGLTVAVLRWAL